MGVDMCGWVWAGECDRCGQVGMGMMGGCHGWHPTYVPNISTLVFVENIGHQYDFKGGGVVSDRVWGGGWVAQIQRNKCFPQNK